MILEHQTRARKAARNHPLLVRLSLVLRVVVVLLSFQLSGLGHAVADLFINDDASAEHDSDCTGDPGKDCPPGCPSCHYPGGSVGSLPPRYVSALLTRYPSSPVVAFVPTEADAPASPDLPPVFRPPKST